MENKNQNREQSDLASSDEKEQVGGLTKLSQPAKSQVDGTIAERGVPKQKTHKELHMENVNFQNNMQSQNAQQAYYVPEGLPEGLPSDELHAEGGKAKSRGISSIVCAVVSIGFLPPIFGIIGIILGLKAKKLGAHTLGNVGVALSVIFMILGMVLSYIYLSDEGAAGGVTGGFLGLM